MRFAKECEVFVLVTAEEQSLVETTVKSIESQARITPLRPQYLLADIASVQENRRDVPACIVISRSCIDAEVCKLVKDAKASFPSIPSITIGGLGSVSCPTDTTIDNSYDIKGLSLALMESIAWSRQFLVLKEQSARIELLNDRELAIVNMAADGMPNKAVAARLGVSIKTVEKNRRAAYEKLNVTSVASMVTLIAFRRYAMPEAVTANFDVESSYPISGGIVQLPHSG